MAWRKGKLRYFLGELVGYALIYSGLARLFLNRRIARGEVTAFYLHAPDKNTFARVMQRARNWGFQFIDDQQLVAYLQGRLKADRPLLHISLDDGRKSIIADVAPYAESHHIPITYFISTQPMDSGLFWWTGVPDSDVHEMLRTVSNQERLDYLAMHYPDREQTGNEQCRETLTPEQVQALAQMRHATIGNHTNGHPILSNCSAAETDEELSVAHARLSSLTNKNISSFAYPSGARGTYEQAVLQRLNYQIAFSTQPAGIEKDERDLYNIPRFSDNAHAGPAENFCRLIGLWQSLYLMLQKKPATYGCGRQQSGMAERAAPAPETVRLLQFIPEPVTTFRADVASLFGKYLPRHRIDCKLVGRSDDHDAIDVSHRNLSRMMMLRKRLFRDISYLVTWSKAILKTNRSNCDLIQVRDIVTIGLLTLCVARLKGIKFCFWVSFLMCEQRMAKARARLNEKLTLKTCLVLLKGKFEHDMLYRFVLPRADHVFAQSDAMAAYFVSRGISAEKITAVPMGVDMEEFSVLAHAGVRPPEWGADAVIAYLGTLAAERNIADLIDAFWLVKQRIPNARLLLIGSSDSKAENDSLVQHAAHKGLSDSVRITGWLPSRDAWKLLLSADVAVSFFPRSLVFDVCTPTKCLEYLAARVPCVANDNPDQAQILLQSDAGALVASDGAAIAEALVQILKDPQKARQRALRGPVYIEEQRSYRVISEMVAHEYRRIAGKPGAAETAPV